MPTIHPFSEEPASSQSPKVVKLVIPEGWQVVVTQGANLAVEVSEFPEGWAFADGPGDSRRPSPNP